MQSHSELVKSIEVLIKAQESKETKLSDVLPHFPGIERVDELVEEFESRVSVLLMEQQERYLALFRAFIGKTDEETLQAILSFYTSEIFDYEVFVQLLRDEAKKFLTMTVEEFTAAIMEALDPDVPFQVLSNRTVTWIEDWSNDLAELMNLSTKESVEKVLVEAIKEGKGIDKVEQELMELKDFDRDRARKTAITEVLTASSVAHQESYAQSPAVVGKKWKHSGTKGINPRANHQALDGTIVPVDEPFTIPDSGEQAMHPRDTNLSAKERVNCHCVLGPVVDDSILGLTAEEKQKLRDEALAELNA
ncbi:phage minor head protein [Shouchella clausii]|uniref:phage minor head protein n=1 Tax=Shouchella clausii TaxID=79880 RepID=UPI00289D38B1|nr:phage minor head protein [Shouchella clausii]